MTTDRTRFWDRNWNCVYDSLSATQTPEEFIREHDWLNATVDTADGRWSGRWINNNGDIEWVRAEQLPDRIRGWAKTPPHPIWTLPDDTRATLVELMARFRSAMQKVDESPRADGRPHPPRPTTTPPMWAVTPQQRRRR